MTLETVIRIIVHKTDNSTIEYIPEIPCLRIVRIGFQLSREIRKDCEEILEFLQARQSGNKIALLYDFQAAMPILQEDLQWIAEEWKPQVVMLGVKHVAIVRSKEEFAQLSIDIINEAMKVAQASTTDQYFPDNDSALEWLQEALSR